ncbi:MAG: CFI-box-CTERM domain-containing protein [Nitrososphaeraceae archaeon]
MKILPILVLLTFVLFPVYAQEQSVEMIQSTDRGTINVGLSTIPPIPNIDEQTKFKINFINKNTNAIQEHIDYSITVTKGTTQVFGIPLTHTAIGSVTIPYEFTKGGVYQVSVDVQGILFQPLPTESAVFSVSVGSGSDKTLQPKNGCLIATAAFGSELAPQVQFLREYRDNTIMATAAGSSFLNVFNAVYYSFSPTVADIERNNPFLQESVRAGITPLLAILQVAKLSSVGDGEISVLTSGIVASSLIGAVYFWPMGLVTKSIRNGTKLKIRYVIVIISAVLALTLISILTGNVQFMMFTTSSTILLLVGIGAMFSAWLIVKTLQRVKITFL